jgi:phosphate transport system ATP-binding protein
MSTATRSPCCHGGTDYHVKEGSQGTSLDIKDFNLWYGKAQALFDINMSIQKGMVTALIGPSGCGKSTLLRCINRMNDLIDDLRIDGQIKVDDFDIYGPGVDVIALRKRMGMVFQKPNPFAMSIYDNVIYPLRVDGITKKSILDETVERSCAPPRCGTRPRTA